jgi:hypothetical protein
MSERNNPNGKAIILVSRAAEEVARMLGIMIALLTAAWFFGSAAATQFVDGILKEQGFATKVELIQIGEEISDLKSADKDFVRTETALSKILEHQSAQIDSIEKLAAESRALSTQILLEIKK